MCILTAYRITQAAYLADPELTVPLFAHLPPGPFSPPAGAEGVGSAIVPFNHTSVWCHWADDGLGLLIFATWGNGPLRYVRPRIISFLNFRLNFTQSPPPMDMDFILLPAGHNNLS